jgi:hypothetical protein
MTCPYCLCYLPPLVPQVSDKGLIWNTDLVEAMELENLLINAAITMHSAERRKVRRGGDGAWRPLQGAVSVSRVGCSKQHSFYVMSYGKDSRHRQDKACSTSFWEPG